MFNNSINEYHSKIEYIDMVLSYIEFAENEKITDIARFLRLSLESDKRIYTRVVDSLLNEQQ